MMDRNYHRWLLVKSNQIYGYDNQILSDDLNSQVNPFADLTKFEYYIMPLKQMGLNDYERRLKKLAYRPRLENANSSAYGSEVVSLK